MQSEPASGHDATQIVTVQHPHASAAPSPAKRHAPKPARAIYDYKAVDTFDLSLKAGEIVTVLELVCLIDLLRFFISHC